MEQKYARPFEEGKFLVEGIHLIKECLSSKLYYGARSSALSQGMISTYPAVVPTKDIEVLYCSEKNFDKISDTVNPQGIIAVVKKPEHASRMHNSEKNDLIIALDNINDPGNLGTIIRSCYWFNVDKIVV